MNEQEIEERQKAALNPSATARQGSPESRPNAPIVDILDWDDGGLISSPPPPPEASRLPTANLPNNGITAPPTKPSNTLIDLLGDDPFSP